MLLINRETEIKVFICSASEDDHWLQELEKHLATLLRARLIQAIWHCQSVIAGKNREAEINKYLNDAQIILLLVSPDFMNSEECMELTVHAMNRSEKGEAYVIPIILRYIDWKDAPFQKLRVLPASKEPVTAWRNVDEALFFVESEIRKILEEVQKALKPKITQPLVNALMTNLTSMNVHPTDDLVSSSFIFSKTFIDHMGPVSSVAFSYDGELLVSDSWDNTIKIWNKHAGQVYSTLGGHAGPVHCVVFSPDTKSLASGGNDTTVKIWDRATGHISRTLIAHKGPVATVIFCSDNTTVVSGSDDSTIRIWNILNGRVLRVLQGHTGPISSIVLNPKANELISASYDGTIKIWNMHSGQLLRDFIGHTGPVSSIAISNDLQTLVSGSHDQTVKIWDIATTRLQHSLVGHTHLISSVSINPDMKTLVSGSYDKTIKIWSLSTGQLLNDLKGHTEAVLAVAFHPEGHILASGSYDKTIKIWQRPHVKIEQKRDTSLLSTAPPDNYSIKRKPFTLQGNKFTIKRRCPSCENEFYLGECSIVSPSRGILKSRPTGLWGTFTARWRVESLLGPDYTLALARRQCPHCRYHLPVNSEQAQDIRIIVVGDVSSGKSHYIAALLHQIQTEWITRTQEEISFICSTLSEEQNIKRSYIEPLFKDKKALQSTIPSFPVDTVPLIYELKMGKSSRKINLVFYDLAGEDYATPELLVKGGRHLFFADAFIFLIDPLAITDVRNKLPAHISLNQKNNRTLYSFYKYIIQDFERFNNKKSRKQVFSIPIAMTLSKSDLFKYTLNPSQSYNFLRNPSYNANIDLDDLAVIDHEVRSIITETNEQMLLQIAADFSNVQFFATSATGSPCDASGGYPLIAPCRCLDPFLWILYQLGITGTLNIP